MARELITPQEALMLFHTCQTLGLPDGSLSFDFRHQIVAVKPIFVLKQHLSTSLDVNFTYAREYEERIKRSVSHLINPYTPFKGTSSDISRNAVDVFSTSRYLFLQQNVYGIILPWQIKMLTGSYMQIPGEDADNIVDIQIWLPPLDGQLSIRRIQDDTGHMKDMISFNMALITQDGYQHYHSISYKE